MDKVEAYSFLFMDSFMGNLVLPPHIPYVQYAMTVFGGYNHMLIAIFALHGMVLGLMVDFALGKLLQSISKNNMIQAKEASYIKIRHFLQKYYYLLVVIFLLPSFGAIYSVALGFFNMSFFRMITFSLLANGAYLIYKLY